MVGGVLLSSGDELDARGLICPQGFAFRGIADEDFALRRPRDELREIYASAGAWVLQKFH
eukprot:3746295-Amphidinium_carterae.1